VVDEASALYWNPAALTHINNRSATFMHATYIESSYYDYGAYAQKLGASGALGIGIQYLSAGKITETDDTGTEIGSFSPSDMAFSVGYAREFDDAVAALDGVSLGLSLKFIRSTIVQSAQTVAADLGVLSPAYMNEKLRMAFTVSNLGGKIKFEEESGSLPLIIKVGSAYKLSERWFISLDLGLPKDNSIYAALGTEYVKPVGDSWSLAGRLGLNSRTLGDVDGLSGLSLGLGVAHEGYSFDYGFTPLGGLGLAHRISLSTNF